MSGDHVGARVDDAVKELHEIVGRNGIDVVATGCGLMRVDRENGEVGALLRGVHRFHDLAQINRIDSVRKSGRVPELIRLTQHCYLPR